MRRDTGRSAALVLALAALLVASSALPLRVAPRTHAPPLVPTAPAPRGATAPAAASAPLPPAPALPVSPSSSSALYDEQLGLTFTTGFYSMLYNVTAVPQVDPVSGTGPAYLLNGLTSSGYWYQVGVSWDWSPGEGFGMNYEVYGPSGASVYPSAAGSGIQKFSGPVHPGDSVSLNLYFKSGEVVMVAVDNSTHAYAQETYSAEGATSFVQPPSSTANSNGYFTGLMTEWYHGSPYYQNQQATSYSTTLPQKSAWMWIDEFACTDSNCSTRATLFNAATFGPVFYADPSTLVRFTSHGAVEVSDAYSFVTGSLSQPTVELTVGYSYLGGGLPSPPAFSYVQGGSVFTANLTTAGSTYLVDLGSAWNVTGALSGAVAGERWVTGNATSGVAAASQTLSFVYHRQYFVGTEGVGGTAGPAPGWFPAGGTVVLLATASPGWEFEGWSGSGAGAYSGSAPSASLTLEGPVNETALFYPGLTVTADRGGTVVYSYGGSAGTVASGSATIYAPVGTEVTLTARPSSLLFVFSGWGGGGKGASETLRLTAPAAAEAHFGYNYDALLAVAAALALAAGALLVWRMRRPAPPSMAA